MVISGRFVVEHMCTYHAAIQAELACGFSLINLS